MEEGRLTAGSSFEGVLAGAQVKGVDQTAMNRQSQRSNVRKYNPFSYTFLAPQTFTATDTGAYAVGYRLDDSVEEWKMNATKEANNNYQYDYVNE